MPEAVRPSSRLHNLGRNPTKPGDHAVTQCKNCRFGIFVGQPREWQRGRRPGLVHVDCDNPSGAAK